MPRRDSDPFLGSAGGPGGEREIGGEAAEPMMRRLRALGGRMVFGLGLIAAGLLATLHNLDWMDARDYFLLWPLLVILFALTQIPGSRPGAERLGAFFWLAVGLVLLASNLGWIRFDVWDLSPLVVAVVGILLVVRALRPRRPVEVTGQPSRAGSEIHGVAFMSGIQRSAADATFSGGSLTAIMGSCKVDLRNSTPPGGRAVLDVLAFWGGIEVLVPPGWRVDNRIMPLLGGTDDKTTPPAPEEVTGTLELTGWVVMAGVEIRNG